MMRGMFAAIAGLRVHQTMLDVTANDIANVNTVGYKSERVTFKDALSQTFVVFEALSGGSAQHFDWSQPGPIAASRTASKKGARTGEARIEDLPER